MLKKSLIQTHPHFREEPIIPITFLLRSKGYPSLSLNQFTETLRAIPHFLENICYFEMWKSQFFFLRLRVFTGGYYTVVLLLKPTKIPIYIPSKALYNFFLLVLQYLVRAVLGAIHNIHVCYLQSLYVEDWLYTLLGTWYQDSNLNLIYQQ